MASLTHLGPAPVMHTERLCLRSMTAGDNAFLRSLLTDPSVRAFLGGAVPAPDVPMHRDRYHEEVKTAPYWTVLDSLRPVGLVSLTPHKDGAEIELSYQFLPGAMGKGLAYEATLSVLAYARKRGISRVIAETQATNVRSVALLGKFGFEPIERLDRFGADQIIYAIRFAEHT